MKLLSWKKVSKAAERESFLVPSILIHECTFSPQKNCKRKTRSTSDFYLRKSLYESAQQSSKKHSRLSSFRRGRSMTCFHDYIDTAYRYKKPYWYIRFFILPILRHDFTDNFRPLQTMQLTLENFSLKCSHTEKCEAKDWFSDIRRILTRLMRLQCGSSQKLGYIPFCAIGFSDFTSNFCHTGTNVIQ